MARVVWGLIVAFVVAIVPALARADEYGCQQLEAALAAPSCHMTSGYEQHTCYTKQGAGDITEVWTTMIYGGTNTGDTLKAMYHCSAGDQCKRKPSYPASYGSDISVCNAGCIYAPEPGGSLDTVRSGGWLAQLRTATYKPTGQTCEPDALPPPPKTRLCGGGSCCDTAANKCCAVTGDGQQVCVPMKPEPGKPGGCISSGDTTLCAGNPPPLPPNPPVMDPPTDIADTDTYGHQDGDGPIVPTIVNNYNTSGGQPNNGATPDDAGDAPGSPNPKPGSGNDPASSSSTGNAGDGTTASGGGDCNTPPICEGSAATCMVVTQTYLLRCPPDGKGSGDGDGEGDGDGTVPGLDGVGEGPGSGFMREEIVLGKLDEGGLGGGGQCPAFFTLDLERFGLHFDDQTEWCDLLEKIRYMLMFLAAWISLSILGEK